MEAASSLVGSSFDNGYHEIKYDRAHLMAELAQKNLSAFVTII